MTPASTRWPSGILKDEFALARGFAHHLEAVKVIAESVGIYNSQRPHHSCIT